ncbi:hypothetical protein F1880_008069 [Penicillium rolfsii]|nr:hypothetical protein F1880_008069 [Penicillium rolfsii]
MRDTSQLYANNGFIEQVVSDISVSGPPTITTTVATKTATATSSTGPSSSEGTLVAQWGNVPDRDTGGLSSFRRSSIVKALTRTSEGKFLLSRRISD